MSSDTIADVAYDGRNKANQALRDIENHERICAERYAGINTSIREIKGWLTWGGTAAFTVIIGLLGFLASAQFNANDEDRRQQQVRIDSLERQLLERAKN